MTISRSKACAAIGGLLLLAGCNGGQAVGNTVTVNSAIRKIAVAAPKASAGRIRERPQTELQAKAFQAVFGKVPPLTRQVDRDEETTSPVQLIWQNDRAVLITKTELAQGCHYCSGSLGIYYLKPAGDTFIVVGKFPRAIVAGSFGHAPEWSVSDKFGSVSTLVSESGTGGQGYACGSIELTELGSDRPRKLVTLTRNYDDTGDGPRPNPGALQVEGKIGKIVPGKSFVVNYTGIQIGVAGRQSFSETYLRTAKGYARVGKSKLSPCSNLSE